jgi:uncharacterized protein
LKWFHKAADRSDADPLAQFNLGYMYYNGWGVPKDYVEAAKWYRLAAERGEARAQFLLGTMYTLSQGVPVDLVQAYLWINLAAAIADDPNAQENAKNLRDAMAKAMTPAQIAEAQKLAREWKPKR